MQLSNVKKVLISALVIGLLLAVACAPTPTATPTPKPSPAPTSTPTPTPTPTAKPSPTPTSTPTPTPTAAKPIELKFACWQPPTDPTYKDVFVRFASEVEKRTNGKVKVTLYGAEALGKAKDQADLIKSGGADLGRILPTYTPGRFAMSEIGNMPFAYPSSVQGTTALWQLYKKGLFDKEYSDYKVLEFVASSSFEIFLTKKKPMNMADLKGILVRTPGGPITKALEVAQMTPLSITAADSYLALQRGTLEASLITYPGSLGYKTVEVSKYVAEVGIGGSVAGILMNKDSFAKLPKDVQDILDKMKEEVAMWDAQSYDTQSGNAKKEIVKANIEIYPFPDAAKWKELSKPLWQDWADQNEKQGKPGKAVLADFLAELAKVGVVPFK